TLPTGLLDLLNHDLATHELTQSMRCCWSAMAEENMDIPELVLNPRFRRRRHCRFLRPPRFLQLLYQGLAFRPPCCQPFSNVGVPQAALNLIHQTADLVLDGCQGVFALPQSGREFRLPPTVGRFQFIPDRLSPARTGQNTFADRLQDHLLGEAAW